MDSSSTGQGKANNSVTLKSQMFIIKDADNHSTNYYKLYPPTCVDFVVASKFKLVFRILLKHGSSLEFPRNNFHTCQWISRNLHEFAITNASCTLSLSL